MPTASKNVSANFGGRGYSNDMDPAEYDLPLGPGEFTLPTAKAVTGWDQSDANTASCTLASGHGLTSGKYNVFWTDTGVDKVRYGVDGTISSNTLSLDGGAGDDFPVDATSGITVSKQVEIVLPIVKANVQYVAITNKNLTAPTSRIHVNAVDGSDASVFQDQIYTEKTAKGPEYIRNVQKGETNPFSDDVAKFLASNQSSVADATLTIFAGVDGTP